MKVGDKFGRWTVIGEPFAKGRYQYVQTHCECGTERSVLVYSLHSGQSLSCGCFHKERVTKHGLRSTPLYSIWSAMLQRCQDLSYENYGGRGITVCDEWKDPKVFCRWAKSYGYKKGLSLDRVDNNGGYSPQNCHFTTPTIQSENRRKLSSNTSGFIGVCQRGQVWRATARKDHKQIYLGSFDTPEEAARVRDSFVEKHYTLPTLNFQVG